jgi:GNAT superfamily N-acetyltransferase
MSVGAYSDDDFKAPAAVISHRQWGPAIRPLAGHELDRFQRHLLRLSGGCRRSRFGNETTDGFVRDYTARVRQTNTVVLGYFEADEVRGAGELRSLRTGWCNEAEAAFSVEEPWQLRGIGTALMVEAVRASRQRGIEHIYLICHVRNRPMQRIAEKFAARMRFDDSECFAHVTVRSKPAPPHPNSDASRRSPVDGHRGD